MKYPSLVAVAVASLGAAVAIAALVHLASRYEMANERAVAPYFFPQKLHGSALQRLAFRLPHFLPIYGSSELGSFTLEKRVKAKPGDFFWRRPTGFVAFPVGHGGTTPLVILQDLAAVGPAVRGRKVVIVLSPSWFTRPLNPKQYQGNFSPLHAGSVIFGNLSPALKADASRRFRQFPATLENSELLGVETALYAAGGPWRTFLARTLDPVGRGWLAILRWSDDVVTFTKLRLLREHVVRDPPPIQRRKIAWAAEEADSEAASDLEAINAPPGTPDPGLPVYARNARPRRKITPLPQEAYTQVEVWQDYDLLLRVLQEMGAKAMILSMPIDGDVADHDQVLFADREMYYAHVRAMAAKHGFPAFTFEEHEYDENFLIRHVSHLTDKGWLYLDQMIDAFYHDKIKT